jgi:hypothetical protein
MIKKSEMKCNTPKKTPGHPTKSHVVKACANGKEKIIRFGQQGVSGSPKKEGESEAAKNRRASFKARHAKNIAKGKMSAAWWASTVKWCITLAILNGYNLF